MVFEADIYLVELGKWIKPRIYAESWVDGWKIAEAIALCHCPDESCRLVYAFREVRS